VVDGRLIAISDVHLDTWRESGEEKAQALLNFLKWVRFDSDCQHFAIVGDLLDVPQSDHSPILPRYREVFTHLWGLMRAGIMVHWVVGNHDGGLMGLDVAMSHPPVQLAYPGVLIRSGERDIWLEHGHNMDAWLWAYLQHRASRVKAVDPADAMAHFREACTTEALPVPATDFVYDTIYEAMQWRAMETGFTDEEKRLGLRVMSQHLDDNFADVAEAGEKPRLQAEIEADLQRLGLSAADLKGDAAIPAEALDLFFPIGLRYYSSLPWRRAAKCRLGEVRRHLGSQVTGLIMGHVHETDLYAWGSEADRVAYANCGTWAHDDGSFILVENGEMTAFPRRWDEPLPQL
jgi:UDP-2,3-diacylglucosamine pyrophosphatase LpxH